MNNKPQDFKHLLGINGLSNKLLETHFSLYEGYVKNANLLLEKLESLSKEGKTETPEQAELKRRFGWEWNGMRLHEYYFENLAKEKTELPEDSVLAEKINQIYGSFKDWEKDFKSVGMMRGIGWVILYYDPKDDELFNVWINEHDVGHFAGAVPLLVMDVFEHAYMVDYGTARADYIENFLKIIDWNKVLERFDKALK